MGDEMLQRQGSRRRILKAGDADQMSLIGEETAAPPPSSRRRNAKTEDGVSAEPLPEPAGETQIDASRAQAKMQVDALRAHTTAQMDGLRAQVKELVRELAVLAKAQSALSERLAAVSAAQEHLGRVAAITPKRRADSLTGLPGWAIWVVLALAAVVLAYGVGRTRYARSAARDFGQAKGNDTWTTQD